MKPIVQHILSATFVILGIFSAGLGLKGFLVPSHFIDGGVTGISMLLSTLLNVNLPVLILAINAPFLVMGYRQINKEFAVKSTLAIVGLALCLALVRFPVVTTDKLLTAVFGGFFLGAGIGLSIRGGGVLDGTEIMALVLSKKVGATLGDIVLLLNIVIFSVAGAFLGIEPAMYSMLTYFSASKTIDFVLHGIEEYNGIIIVSARSEAIRDLILNDLGRGVTIYKGQGGLSETEHDILFCVVTRLEVPKVKKIVRETDEKAFVVTHHIIDAGGGMVKKRAWH